MISSNARFRFDAPSNVSNIHCGPKTEYTPNIPKLQSKLQSKLQLQTPQPRAHAIPPVVVPPIVPAFTPSIIAILTNISAASVATAPQSTVGVITISASDQSNETTDEFNELFLGERVGASGSGYGASGYERYGGGYEGGSGGGYGCNGFAGPIGKVFNKICIKSTGDPTSTNRLLLQGVWVPIPIPTQTITNPNANPNTANPPAATQQPQVTQPIVIQPMVTPAPLTQPGAYGSDEIIDAFMDEAPPKMTYSICNNNNMFNEMKGDIYGIKNITK